MGRAVIFRVVRRRKFWRVQEKRGWFWRYIGPYGYAPWGKWEDSAGAIWFANLCERVEGRKATLDASREGLEG